jgi:hypothetical protein
MALTTAQMMAELEQMRPHLDIKVTAGMDAIADLPEAAQAAVVPALYSMMLAVKKELDAEKKKVMDVEEKVEKEFGEWVKEQVEKAEVVEVSVLEEMADKLSEDTDLQIVATHLLLDKKQKIRDAMTSKGKKKKGSGTRAKAENAVEWVVNTEEEAKDRYTDSKEGWTPVKDYENKTTYLEIVKLYKAGQKDPRPEDHPDHEEDGILKTDLHKKKHTPVVREGEHGFQSGCEDRCCGAKVWKQGRNASLYCKDEGIKSATVMLCNEKRGEGSDFCKVCAKKGVNFWEGRYGGKDSDKMWSDYLKGDNVTNLALENA